MWSLCQEIVWVKLRLTKFQTTIQCPLKPPTPSLIPVLPTLSENEDVIILSSSFFLIETYISQNMGIIFYVDLLYIPFNLWTSLSTNATIMNLLPASFQAKFTKKQNLGFRPTCWILAKTFLYPEYYGCDSSVSCLVDIWTKSDSILWRKWLYLLV